MGICHYDQETAFPSKGFFFSFLFRGEYVLCVLLKHGFSVLDKKERFSVQVKNKPRARIRNMRLFLVHQST
jgi:hypothetical protein